MKVSLSWNSDVWLERAACHSHLRTKYITLSPRSCTLNQIMIITKIIIMISMIMLIINNHDPNHHDFVESSCGPQPHQLRRHDILCGPFHFIIHWILAAHPFEMIAMI